MFIYFCVCFVFLKILSVQDNWLYLEYAFISWKDDGTSKGAEHSFLLYSLVSVSAQKF